MNTKTRILISIPSKSHVEIAGDELRGLQDLGYFCDEFSYSAKAHIKSKVGRFFVVIYHSLLLVFKAYKFKPTIIYFNSRLEVIACTRDFITLFLFKLFYFKKVLFIIKSHGSDLEVLDSGSFFMKNIVLTFLRKHITAWLFLSTEEKNNVIKNGFLPANRIFVTKNIVRETSFLKDSNFRAKFGIPKDSLILLFTGRFIREKGIYEIIDAFSQLQKDYNATLILVGDGPEREQLEHHIQLKNLSEKVIFTGFIPESEVRPFYANSDILVFPTYCQEGFPMALFNSVAAGLSIVTTAIRAANDYLKAPDNCLWVEPQNSKSIQKALVTLLQSPELRQQMGSQNIQKGKIFSKEKVCKEISLIIDSIIINSNL